MSPSTPNGEGPVADDVARLRAALDEERRRAQGRVEALTREFDAIVAATEDANTDDEHDPEGATIGFERAQVAALRDQAATRLTEVDAAERRLADDTISDCVRCGGVIDVERLLVRPTTRWCRRCAD